MTNKTIICSCERKGCKRVRYKGTPTFSIVRIDNKRQVYLCPEHLAELINILAGG